MKKLPPVSFGLLLLIILFTLAQSCNNNANTSSNDKTLDKPLSETEITEAKLPKGKLVIDEGVKNINKPNDVDASAINSNKPDNRKTNNEVPKIEESRSDKLKKKYKNLLVFHADDTMEVNRPKLAVLILAKDESVEKMKIQVLDEAEAQDEKIKFDTTMDFGSKMRAKLIPFGGSKMDNNFEIEALGDDEQSFKSDRKKIIWQWKITPMKEGEYELKLSVQIIEKDGEAVSLPAKNIPVVIFAKEETMMSKVGNFFSTKYEWIITAVLLPVFIAWFTRVRRNRQMHKTPPDIPV